MKRIGRAILIVIAVCFLGLATYTALRDSSFHPRPFDASAWRKSDSRGRGEMVASLRDQSVLREKPREDVIALLGRADEDLQGLLKYRVDVGRRIVWKPFLVSLVVEFDQNGRVHRVSLVD